MRLKNTSRYPDAEVRALIEFGTKGVNLAGVAVHVKNSAHAYAGRAYYGVPSCSPAAKLATVERLVVLRIGAPEKFPVDNLRTTWKRGPWILWEEGQAAPDPEGFNIETWRHWLKRQGGQLFIRYGEAQRHPYGGKRSPLIVMQDWREGLVGLAAHEARHIHQFRHRKPVSEVDCERFAAKRLEEFRAARPTD